MNILRSQLVLKIASVITIAAIVISLARRCFGSLRPQGLDRLRLVLIFIVRAIAVVEDRHLDLTLDLGLILVFLLRARGPFFRSER